MLNNGSLENLYCASYDFFLFNIDKVKNKDEAKVYVYKTFAAWNVI